MCECGLVFDPTLSQRLAQWKHVSPELLMFGVNLMLPCQTKPICYCVCVSVGVYFFLPEEK